MNRHEALKRKLDNRELVCGTTCTLLESTVLLTQMDHPAMDFMLFDGEHGRYNAENVLPLLHTCRMMDLPSIVRVSDACYHLVAKQLYMGADGIMLPRTETLEQLKEAVDAMRFYPAGRIGKGGIGQLMGGESLDTFNHTRFLMPQIESPRGIENLPAMLDTYGDEIAAVMIGPYDLSILMGTPLNTMSEEVQAGVQKIFDLSRAYGKSCGIFCDDTQVAEHYRKMGANVLWTGLEVQLLQMGINQTFGRLSQL